MESAVRQPKPGVQQCFVSFTSCWVQEKLRKMTPEARQKYKERKQKLEQQRSMSKFVRKK